MNLVCVVDSPAYANKLTGDDIAVYDGSHLKGNDFWAL